MGGINDDLHEKLSNTGLVPARQTADLGKELQRYIDAHAGGKSPATVERWSYNRDKLVLFFGMDRDVTTITPQECQAYKTWLFEKKKLANSTVGRCVRAAKMFFTEMVNNGIILRNPFAKVQGSNTVDETRNHYISVETTLAAMEYCPNAEMRAVLALSRFAGLRPGEILVLTIDAIKWDRDRFIVTSPKTKRHVGGGQREVPIFPELKPYLLDVVESAKEGAVYVLDRFRERSKGLQAGKKPNLGKLVNDYFERAGYQRFPKPFTNLRGSCETDLAGVYPLQVVTSWIGNSPKVAQKHYLKVLPSHYEQAQELCIFSKKEPVDTSSNHVNRRLKSTKNDCAKTCAVHAKNASQINKTANKKAVNCTVLQLTANGCAPQNYPART